LSCGGTCEFIHNEKFVCIEDEMEQSSLKVMKERINQSQKIPNQRENLLTIPTILLNDHSPLSTQTKSPRIYH
jgi:hypothetical protein